MVYNCVKCKQSLRSEVQKVQCGGFCKAWYHAKKCLSLSDYDITMINSQCNIKFICDLCVNSFEQIKMKFDTIIENISKMNNSMHEAKKEILEGVIKTKNELANEMNNGNANENGMKNVTSYADVLKVPVIIRPKNVEQNSKITKKDLKTKIDVCKLPVKMNNIYERRKGVISICCSNSDLAKKIEEEVKKKMGGGGI